jgi:hypothetical protein
MLLVLDAKQPVEVYVDRNSEAHINKDAGSHQARNGKFRDVHDFVRLGEKILIRPEDA